MQSNIQCSITLLAVHRETGKSAAYTDASKSSLEMTCWLHDLTQRRKTFQSSTQE